MLAMHVANLFSGLLLHGSLIDDFLACTIVPIPKGRNFNLTDCKNYRAWYCTQFCVWLYFDLIILQRYSDKLDSCDLQFGFKKGRSTAMCTMIAK